jgi:hypothetical protein
VSAAPSSAPLKDALVDAMYKAMFDRPRDATSAAYKAGARAWIKRVVLGHSVRNPYSPGTAECDAFWSGKDGAIASLDAAGFKSRAPLLDENRA